jgi:serine/threonine protein phosphatase PrpC
MADLVVRVGGRSEQGVRPNNEDCYVMDREHNLFLVADGMGGQDLGEQASSMAAQIIPRAVQRGLDAQEAPGEAVQRALAEANQAIIHAGRHQAPGRRMGTTAVVAVQKDDQVYVASIGDSRAYLIRGDRVDQLTVDHSVAKALELSGTLTPEQARDSPWQHVLYKFLGCAEMTDGADVRPFAPQAGDRLLLASDGLTNHVSDDDLRDQVKRHRDPQALADSLVQLALKSGSKDNVTCVVVAFDAE